MEILLDYTIEEIEQKIIALGLPKFRAGQVFLGLYKGLSFNEITTLSKDIKQKLSENFIAQPVEILKEFESKDGTVKFLFKLHDNNVIEGVLMKYKYGYTLCVSTQIGCRMHCKFCASGLDGLKRNLSAGEILGQVVSANKYLNGDLGENRKITNVVLMGSGEPLDNYDNVTKFLRLVSHEKGLNISERNISLSTCGLVPEIRKLTDEDYKITLTISLHASTNEKRKEIMPIAFKYSIQEIVSACKYYFEKTKRRVVFEYVLIKGVNDSEEDVLNLKNLLKGLSSHVNVIALNEVKESKLTGTNRQNAAIFVDKLNESGVSATLRRTMGQDIEGACGQLRRRYLKDNV